MLYTIPDYYHEFSCVAGKCEDTCCAGWQIVADEAALEKYKNETGAFAERLKESVNWEEGTFKQDKDRRCAFLNQSRDVMIDILQDREKKLNLRAALILAIARDLQECIDEEDIFSMDDVFDYYQAEEGVREVKNALAEVDYYTYSRRMFQNQYQMEHLRADWESYLQEAGKLLYRNVNEKIDKKQYIEMIQEFHAWMAKEMPEYEIQYEQLLVYFISTYFCGAVYDGEAFAKAQMAVVSTLLIHELLMAQWMKQEKVLDINDVIDTVYRYSRELEHSDSNLNLMQELLQESNE